MYTLHLAMTTLLIGHSETRSLTCNRPTNDMMMRSAMVVVVGTVALVVAAIVLSSG
jgi:hypothetical protein